MIKIVPKILSVNGVYAGLGLATLQIDSGIRSLAIQQIVWVMLGLVVLEVVTIVAIWRMERPKEALLPVSDLFCDAPEAIIVRNSIREDSVPATEVFGEWFSKAQMMPAADFSRLTGRGSHVRIAEEVYSGSARRVVGYYTIWPMTREHYDALVEGRLRECQFTSDMILKPDSEAAEVLYIAEICVRKTSNAGGILLRDAMSYVAWLFGRHSQLQLIAAWGSTDVGRSISSRMGMAVAKRRNGRATEFFDIKRQDACDMFAKAPDFVPERRVDLAGA